MQQRRRKQEKWGNLFQNIFAQQRRPTLKILMKRMSKRRFDKIEDAIEDIKQGKMIVVVDDEDRENEGDLCCAAEKITPELINFMAVHGRGLICLTLTPKKVEALGLQLMTQDNQSQFGTNFTVSIEAREGVTTGISAADRATTVLAAVSEDSGTHSITSPGHIFPLKSKEGGVLRRTGQTEASVDLARMAGLNPSGVICEIMNEDGTMARYTELRKFCDKHELKLVTVADLITYRLQNEIQVKRIETARLPTSIAGEFKIIGFENILNHENYIALTKGKWKKKEPVLTRVHSQCLTGDVFSSIRCDCRPQLHESMRMIEKEGKGVILYLAQEGRGIGIINKIRAYKLQDQGADTVDANEKLGFKADLRDYGFGAQVLSMLGLSKLKLMTNNPKKIIGLEGYGLEVVERVPIEIPAGEENEQYMDTKKKRLGHFIRGRQHP